MDSSQATAPAVTITRRGADRIRAGHVWVYRSDVVEAKDIAPGALVSVSEAGGRGRLPAHTNSRHRPLQFVFGNRHPDDLAEAGRDIEQLVRERIRAAVAYRERFVHNTNAYRVIFSEGDFLPGLIVDRYNDILSLQVLTQAMDSEAMRRIVSRSCRRRFSPGDFRAGGPGVRKLEQLDGERQWNSFAQNAERSPQSGRARLPPPEGRRRVRSTARNHQAGRNFR